MLVELVEQEIPPTLILLEVAVVLALVVNQGNKPPILLDMVGQERE
tara:strand:+ start:559 stop:696 length:138 start_codon:yes stop_codon:yes gene_type:complete